MSDFHGDPWVFQWAGHKVYEADVDLLVQVASGHVETDSRYPDHVYISGKRGAARQARTLEHLVEVGLVHTGRSVKYGPDQPTLFTINDSYVRVPHNLAPGVQALLEAAT